MPLPEGDGPEPPNGATPEVAVGDPPTHTVTVTLPTCCWKPGSTTICRSVAMSSQKTLPSTNRNLSAIARAPGAQTVHRWELLPTQTRSGPSDTRTVSRPRET